MTLKFLFMKQADSLAIPEEVILTKIFLIRGYRVMIDRDLAELYGVETRTLNQAVRRNLKRFPEDFMFQLSVQEFENWKSQIVISNSERMSIRKAPLVFTTMRTMLSSQKYLILALERIQNKQVDHEEKIS